MEVRFSPSSCVRRSVPRTNILGCRRTEVSPEIASHDPASLLRRGWPNVSSAAFALERWDVGSIPHRACGELSRRESRRLYGTLA